MAPSKHSYEPFRHVQEADEYDAEKLLAPDLDEQHRIKQQNPRRQKNRAAPSCFRITLRAVALFIAVSILAVQVHSAYVWLDTRRDTMYNAKTGFQTRLWAYIDIWPTWTMLGAALLATVIQLLALMSLCSCFRHIRGSSWHATSFYLSSALVIAAWVAALVYFKVVDSQGKDKSHWDLWSWTCHRKSQHGKVPWAAMCIEQNYTFFASIVVVITEFIGVIIFVVHQRGLKTQINYRKVDSAWGGWMPMTGRRYKASNHS